MRYHRSDDSPVDNARDTLVDNLIKIVTNPAFEQDGISIFIDEVDGPAEATLCKLAQSTLMKCIFREFHLRAIAKF